MREREKVQVNIVSHQRYQRQKTLRESWLCLLYTYWNIPPPHKWVKRLQVASRQRYAVRYLANTEQLTVKGDNSELSTVNKPGMFSLRCNRACYTTIQLLVATRQGTIAS